MSCSASTRVSCSASTRVSCSASNASKPKPRRGLRVLQGTAYVKRPLEAERPDAAADDGGLRVLRGATCRDAERQATDYYPIAYGTRSGCELGATDQRARECCEAGLEGRGVRAVAVYRRGTHVMGWALVHGRLQMGACKWALVNGRLQMGASKSLDERLA